MKRFMIIAGLALLSLCLVTSMKAQVSAGSSMVAEVGTDLVVSENSNGDFTTVSPGVTYTISPAGIKVPGGPDSPDAYEDVQPVDFLIEGSANSAVAVTMMLTDRMFGDAGGIMLVDYNSQSAGWNNADDFGAQQTLFDPRVGTTLFLSADGLANVYLGCVLTVPVSAPAGGYTGVVGLTASYTGF